MGESADKKDVKAIRQAVNLHASVIETVELLTTRLAPKQITVNAHVNRKTF